MFGLAAFFEVPFFGIGDNTSRLADSLSAADSTSATLSAVGFVADSVAASSATTAGVTITTVVNDAVVTVDAFSAVLYLGKTKYGRQVVLEHMLGVSNFAFITLYAALFTADPTNEGSIADELTALGYARVDVSSLLNDAELSTSDMDNASELVFGPAGEAWPTVTFLGIMDSAPVGTGNMLYFGTVIPPQTTLYTDYIRYPIGSLLIEER